MRSLAKYSVLFLCIAAVFVLGMNVKKVMRSSNKKGKKEAIVNGFPVLEHKPFVIVIPSYNNAKWAKKNLYSALEQKYDNFRVIYIDDASKDATLETVLKAVKESDQGFRVDVWHNEKNCGAMENIYRAVSSCAPEEIIVMLDGDDFLSHENVLYLLNEVYADPDAWMTCGSYLEMRPFTYHSVKPQKEIPRDVLENNSLRKYVENHFMFSHLKTFYAGIFQKINVEDFKFEGAFFDASSDQAFMIPIAEMAGEHYRFVKDILYIYNRTNPINDDKVRGQRQVLCFSEVRSRPSYKPLEKLVFNNDANSGETCSKEPP